MHNQIQKISSSFNGDGNTFAVPIPASGLPHAAEHPAPSPSAADASIFTTFLAEVSQSVFTGAQVRQGVPLVQFDSYFTFIPSLIVVLRRRPTV